MWRFPLLPAFIVAVVFSGPCALAQNAISNVQNLEGRYERTGVVDRAVEAQFEGLGPVLPRPVFIDGHLPFPPKRWLGEDKDFIVQRLGNSDYIFILPKEDKRCRLADYGSLTELNDGTLLLRRRVTLAGEGTIPVGAVEEVRLSKGDHDAAKWLVIETRIEWTKRSLFRSKKMEYRSVVRFREVTV